MSRLNILEIFSTVALLKRKLNKLPVFKKGKIMIYYYKWEQLSQLTSSEYKDISRRRKSMKYVSFAYYHLRDRRFPCWPDLSLRHYFPIPESSVERRFGRDIWDRYATFPMARRFIPSIGPGSSINGNSCYDVLD